MASEQSVPAQRDGSPSTADLVARAAEQISTLIRDEIALAKSELVTKGKKAAIGGGLFGGAAVLAAYGAGLLLILAVVALNLVWALWLAVLVVAVAVFVIAAIAGLIGRRQLASAAPPLPSEAIAGITADVNAVKDAVREGHSA